MRTDRSGDPAAAREAAAAKRLPGRRIVVVDDNDDSARSLAALLRAMGQQVQVAFDGPSAIEVLRSVPADIVFLDLAMPQMDGFEVARILRSAPDFGPVRLVAVTGLGQPGDVQATIAAGFDAHITKPAPLEVIDETLRRLLASESGGAAAMTPLVSL